MLRCYASMFSMTRSTSAPSPLASSRQVIRVAMACIRNLVSEDKEHEAAEVTASILNLLIANGLPKTLSNLKVTHIFDSSSAR